MAGAPRGPAVGQSEFLLRVITCAGFWASDQRRPSSAAFDHPRFSADIESLVPQLSVCLARFAQKPDTQRMGLVRFKCADAVNIGFSPHREPDPNYPENEAHANVYCDHPNKERKRRARRLAQCCIVVDGFEPGFSG